MTSTTFRSQLLTAVLSYVILYVHSKNTNEKYIGSEALKEDYNFYQFLERFQDENQHARLLINVKKSLDSTGKKIPSTAYKRMKTKFLKSLKTDFLRRRALYDEQGHNYENVDCGLRAIPQEVPYPERGFAFPAFIELHRCSGACLFHLPTTVHCAVQKTSTILVNAMYFFPHEPPEKQQLFKVVKMVNHTKCGCQCVVQKHHCDEKTERYDPDQCKCLCRNLSHTCDNKTKEWSMDECGCTCIEQPKPCRTYNQLWSPETCNCQCLDSIKKRCIRKNKLLDKESCKCYCPDVVCPAGTELHQYDCKCIENNGV